MAGVSRKRQRPSRKEEEQQKYYDKLLHMCRKDLNKQAKTTKNFECQKLIRKLKDNHTQTTQTADAAGAITTIKTSAETTATTNTNTNMTNRNEVKLQELRDLPMEPIIRECLRRLGILTLNPKPNPAAASDATTSTSANTKLNLNVENDENETSHTDQVDDDSQNEKEKKDNEPSTAGSTGYNKDWIEHILQHKRMREILEKWIDNVTEYRRWCVRQEEGTKKKGKKSKKGHFEKQQEEPALQAEQLSNSLFVRLGDHPSDDDESDDDEGDGDGDNDEMENQKKKNRPGQRARKAKFDAKQLRKEGPTPDSFQKWMPSKQTSRNPSYPDSNPNTNRQGHAGRPLDSSSSKKSAAPGTNASVHQTGAATQRTKHAGVAVEKDLHPSWKASKTQQAGIVAFQGKKITFD